MSNEDFLFLLQLMTFSTLITTNPVSSTSSWILGQIFFSAQQKKYLYPAFCCQLWNNWWKKHPELTQATKRAATVLEQTQRKSTQKCHKPVWRKEGEGISYPGLVSTEDSSVPTCCSSGISCKTQKDTSPTHLHNFLIHHTWGKPWVQTQKDNALRLTLCPFFLHHCPSGSPIILIPLYEARWASLPVRRSSWELSVGGGEVKDAWGERMIIKTAHLLPVCRKTGVEKHGWQDLITR